MEGKQVPWWRKALNLALNGIRSGFGLFSRPQKHTDEIEPETVAGSEEIREEAELTEHSPELNSRETETASAIEAEVAPVAKIVAAHELVPPVEPTVEVLAQQFSVPEAEVEIEAPDAGIAVEPHLGAENVEALPDATAEVLAPIEEAPSEPEPIVEESTFEPSSEPIAEVKTEPVIAAADTVADTVADVATLEEEPVSEPAQEAETTPSDIAPEEVSAADVQVEEVASLVDLLPEHEDGIPAAEEDVQEQADATEAIIEDPAVVAEAELDPVAANNTAVENSDLQSNEEAAADVLEVPAPEPPVEPVIEDGFEQVTEQQVTVENVLVDEVAPQAESAVSEDSAPESASPVLEESIEPAAQAVEESGEEPVEVAASDASDLNTEEIASESTEAAEAELVEQEEITEQEATVEQGENVAQNGSIDQNTEQNTEPITGEIADEVVDQAVEQPMGIDHSNSEPAAEQEEAAEIASPVPAIEEPASAPDAPAVPVPPEEPVPPAEPVPAEEAVSVEEPAPSDEPTAVPAATHPSKPFIKHEAKEGEVNVSPFSVIVSQVYDGPLDLLLDLIRKQDIDIYDIPIARITAQFLAYVNQLKASDVDVAGEFIYTASLLIHIKSKMLLPRAPSGPDDAAEDPRRELVERLLEHERFKNAAQMLQQKQMLEAATVTNPGVREFKEDAGAEPEIAADTVDLVRVFREILERARNRPILNVEEDSVTVGQMIQFLSRRLSMEDHPIALRKLLSHSRSERALIAMFLALLELVRLQAILLRQDLAFSEIFIKKHSNFESVMNDAVTHDDWR